MATLLLLIVVLAPMQWQSGVRATDPSVNGAIAEQRRMERDLARQRTQLAELQRTNAHLAATLMDIKNDLESLGLEIDRASSKIEAMTLALAEARRQLARYVREIDTLEQTLSQLSVDIETSKVELVDREGLLQEHLRIAYEQSQTSVLEVLLSTDSFTRASSELSYMLTLSDEDRLLANEIRERRSMLQTRRQTLLDGRASLPELRANAAARAASLAAQQTELNTARASLEEQQAQLELLRDAREEEFVATGEGAEAQLQLIAAQEQALAAQEALVQKLKDIADRLDIAYRGRFAWPERGPFLITQEFSVSHKGLDMAYLYRCGQAIYAAGDGIVVADGRPNAKYGDYAIGVLIAHSQRLATQYWHLSREVVTVGQDVHLGDVIGYEGATGFATGCHLHFGVLFNGAPANPRKYLP
ncbi:MAG: peptidoglycan DD-metalloendopeptidase family protein [Chloroflexota bacterium]|nr:peptidoglycan DD-metalloendopeptidase family protein [Chloroflexota bacterium]